MSEFDALGMTAGWINACILYTNDKDLVHWGKKVFAPVRIWMKVTEEAPVRPKNKHKWVVEVMGI